MRKSGKIFTEARDQLQLLLEPLLNGGSRNFFLYANIDVQTNEMQFAEYYPGDVGEDSRSLLLCNARDAYTEVEKREKVFSVVFDYRENPTELSVNVRQCFVIDFNVTGEHGEEITNLWLAAKQHVANLNSIRGTRVVIFDGVEGTQFMDPATARQEMHRVWAYNNRDILHRNWSALCIEPTIKAFGRKSNDAYIRLVKQDEAEILLEISDLAHKSEFFPTEVDASMCLTNKGVEQTVVCSNDDNVPMAFAVMNVFDDWSDLQHELGTDLFTQLITSKNLTSDNCIALFIRYLLVKDQVRNMSVSHFIVDELVHYVEQMHPGKIIFVYVHVAKPPNKFHLAKEFWKGHQQFDQWLDLNEKLEIGVLYLRP